MVDQLAVYSPTDQKYVDMMRKLQNVDVLIIDDFLTIGISQRGQEDLTKIIFDSQSSATYWLQAFPDRVGADSLVSRLNTGQRIQIGDFDMRQHLALREHAQRSKAFND